MDNEIAIKVSSISKTFRIPHEKVSSLRGAAVSFFSRNKGYEEFKALDDISFEVKKGEFFGIIGRNGSGKSTLLKILAGIYQADKGSVKVNGMISPFLELGIGFNPELSGRDNVYLNATVLGMSKKQIDEKFDSIVKFSELERFIDQKLKNYSSGMQVRLAFSVSIHANREILLMDEVLAVGDSNFQSKCLEEFRKYRNLNKTVILVTHDINIVRQHCDRAIFIKNGKIEKIGNSNDVCDRYMIENVSDKSDEMEAKENEKKNIVENVKKIEKKIVIDDANIEPESDFGNKNILIKNITLLDVDYKKKQAFFCGDVMRIDISYYANEDVQRPHFGISMRDVNGTHLVSTNHLRKKQIIENIKKGESGHVVITVNKIPFVLGEFMLDAMLYTDKIGRIPKPIHHINDAARFSIINNNTISDDGLIYLDCDWKFNK